MNTILKKICELKSISASALSNKLGCSRGFIKSVKYKKEDQLLYKLLALYPDLNPYFLITGEGDSVINLSSPSKVARIGSMSADYKVLYEQIRLMYDDVVKNNRKQETTIRTLSKQNAELIERINSLSNND